MKSTEVVLKKEWLVAKKLTEVFFFKCLGAVKLTEIFLKSMAGRCETNRTTFLKKE